MRYSKMFNVIELPSIKVENPEYFLSVDTYDELMPTYCLARRINNKMEIILLKTIKDKDEFKQEVENISKYFNTLILY